MLKKLIRRWCKNQTMECRRITFR